MATKSEIRKVKNTLGNQLAVLERYTKLHIPNAQIGIVEICHAENAVRIISGVLQFLRDYVVDENDYQYGCELELEVRNTFDLFLEKAHGEKERLNGAIPGEMYLNDISETMVDLIDWLDETEEKPQDTPTISTAANGEEADKPLFDKEALKGLFVEVFFANDYSLKDTYKSTIKQSRFDVFCSRLELVLNDTDKKPTQKDIGAIAYMIYCSKFAKPDFKKPKRKGEKGCFAHLIRTFFEIVKIDQPSDPRPNKYNNPNNDLVAMFCEVLEWER